MKQPLISIVTPTYNQGRFLEQTLLSVLSQGYPNLEYIVIDGGSTDDTAQILKKHERHLSFWVSEPDRGQTHAINKGMVRAKGELRAYLNSDDILLPGSLAAIAQAYRDNPDADIFHGRCLTIDERGERLPRTFHADIRTPADILDLWRVWWGGRNFVQPEVFWTARIADKIGPFDEQRHYAMDYDYWCRAILVGAKVCRLERDIAAFRLWSAQKSTAATNAAAELRSICGQHIWDRRTPIPWWLRLRLQADWLYDEVYATSAGRLAHSGAGAASRRLQLLGVAMRHPQLLLSSAFREHMAGRLAAWSTRSGRRVA